MTGRRLLLNAACLIAIIAAFSPSLLAQWGSYPTPGVPKTPDGKPNLTAPAPRTPDGKPDLSGIWEASRGPGGGQRGAAPGAGDGPPPAAPPPPPANANAGPPLAAFFEIGAGFKEGPPYTPWAAEVKQQRAKDNAKDNPDAHCL